MGLSNIQWTDYTWNVARGCTKVDDDCRYCYMYRDSFNGTRYNPREIVRTKTVFNLPLKIKETESKVWSGKPLVFTSSLTDVFHPAIDSYRNEMWDIIRQCPHLIFQILTKRPERIAGLLPNDWFRNFNHVWFGTSVGHTGEKSLKRIVDLIRLRKNTGIPNVLFLSMEPLWGEIKVLERLLNFGNEGFLTPAKKLKMMQEEYPKLGVNIPVEQNIDWIIVGGESGNEKGKDRYRPCELSWIENIVSDCKEAGVPVFVKQLGTHLSKELKMSDRHGGNIAEFPKPLQLREFPSIN